MADVRISVVGHRQRAPVEVQTAGLRKVRLFNPIMAGGFSASDINRAWAALDGLERHLGRAVRTDPVKEARRRGSRDNLGVLSTSELVAVLQASDLA